MRQMSNFKKGTGILSVTQMRDSDRLIAADFDGKVQKIAIVEGK